MKRFFGITSLLIALALPSLSHAATLTFGGVSSAAVGQTISVPLLLSTAGAESANAVSATVEYSRDMLTLVSISKSGSIISLWPQEPSTAAGRGDMEGVILNPGWSGTGGVVATLVFQVKAAGKATIAFSDADVLANDGSGTSILKSSSPKTLTITDASSEPAPVPTPTPTPVQTNTLPPVHIRSSSHPDQTAWYEEHHVVFDWTNAQGISAVRIGYDKEENGVGTVVYSPAISHKEVDLDDGVWYFHVQEKQNGAWGAIATYTIHIGQAPAVATTTEPVATTTEPAPAPTQSFIGELIESLQHHRVAILTGLALILAFILGWISAHLEIHWRKRRSKR